MSVLEEHSAPVTSINVISSGGAGQLNVIVSGSMDGTVCVWDLKTCNLLRRVATVKGSVNAMKLATFSKSM